VATRASRFDLAQLFGQAALNIPRQNQPPSDLPHECAREKKCSQGRKR
jgi:hypothetical protein